MGSFYTPESVTRPMVAACLAAWRDQRESAGRPPRILDPACGDGAFIVELFAQLAASGVSASGIDSGNLTKPSDTLLERTPAEKIGIISESLHGVDVDEAAVSSLRERLRQMLGADCAGDSLEEILHRNFRVGDSLSGLTFTERAKNASLGIRFGHTGFVWNEAFPVAAAAGGFDIVIGNPPYLRERDARELFDQLAETPLGRRWRQARMDLWYYFVHCGLDVLRPAGILSFVVSRYWTSSRGAGKLIERLQQETTFQEMRLLKDRKVFPGVSGRHMTFRLRCRSSEQGDVVTVFDEELDQEHRLPHGELFHSGRVLLTPLHSSLETGSVSRAVTEGEPSRCKGVTLGDLFETRQGIAENPPWVSAALARRVPGPYTIGDGVFVLTTREIEQLEFTESEHQLLRPYFQTRSLDRYRVPTEPTHSILYLTGETAPNLEAFPKVAAHLGRFRALLETRREVRQQRIAWWHLHWPREERIFTEPRILAIQMGHRPRFVFTEAPTFVGFSVNVIRHRTGTRLSLEALTGLLNSAWAARWFQRHAKHRGANLDISGIVLREFPLPPGDGPFGLRLSELVRQRQAAFPVAAAMEGLDGEMDQLVDEWYASGAGTSEPSLVDSCQAHESQTPWIC